jgi:hypothetical protein
MRKIEAMIKAVEIEIEGYEFMIEKNYQPRSERTLEFYEKACKAFDEQVYKAYMKKQAFYRRYRFHRNIKPRGYNVCCATSKAYSKKFCTVCLLAFVEKKKLIDYDYTLCGVKDCYPMMTKQNHLNRLEKALIAIRTITPQAYSILKYKDDKSLASLYETLK